MEIDIPTTEDIHRIAYVTMHGWSYGDYSGWRKLGCYRTCHDRKRELYPEPVHSLEQAYIRAQEDADNG